MAMATALSGKKISTAQRPRPRLLIVSNVIGASKADIATQAAQQASCVVLNPVRVYLQKFVCIECLSQVHYTPNTCRICARPTAGLQCNSALLTAQRTVLVGAWKCQSGTTSGVR